VKKEWTDANVLKEALKDYIIGGEIIMATSHALDSKRRSKEGWERGRGAKRIGNPRYKPVVRKGRKVYVLRKR
jgi:hypothetical protein